MRFVTSLLFAATVLTGTLLSPYGVSAAGQVDIGILGSTGGQDPVNQANQQICSAISVYLSQNAAVIPDFKGQPPANLPALPATLSCITDPNPATAFRVVLKLIKENPATPGGLAVSPSASVWTAAGWPSTPLKDQDYQQLTLLLASLSIVDGLSGLMSGLSGIPGLFSGLTGGADAGTGSAGFPAFPPPSIPGFDFNNLFNGNTVGKLCRVQCAQGTLCINENQCITPQAVCNTPCGLNQFCQSAINGTLLATINNLLTGQGGASAGAGAGASAGNGGIGITIGANGQVVIPGGGAPDLSTLLQAFKAGGQVQGACQPLESKCAAGCPAGQVCSPYEGCRPCAACAGIDLSAFLNGASDPTRFTGNATITRGQGNAETIQAGIIAQIQAGANNWATLTFGAQGGAAGGAPALLPIPANAVAQARDFISNLQDAALQIAADAAFQATNLIIRANATLNVVLAGPSSRAGCNTSAQLDGPLIIRGVATAAEAAAGRIGGYFSFPPSSPNANPNAIINAAGNVFIDGDLGAAKLSIAAITAAAAAASVPAGATLKTIGAVLGAAGNLVVNGSLWLGGSSFEPRLTIPSGGRVTVSVGASGNFSCGDLFLAARGQIDIIANTTRTAFKNFTKCEAGAVIRVKVTSVASAKSGVLFAYGSITSSIVIRSFQCTIKLFDDSNNEVTLTNPNTVSGRRLLADSTAPTVTWSENGASYGTSATDGTTNAPTTPAPTKKSNNAHMSTPTHMVGLMAIVISMVARLF